MWPAMAAFPLAAAAALLLLLLASAAAAPPPPASSYDSRLGSGSDPAPFCPTDFTTMFAVGDSTTDTGNAVRSPQHAVFQEAAEAPYGSSYFPQPTGRFSDGRMMVDLVAQALRRPLLLPHLGLDSNLSHGSQNFAVAGATALDAADLARLASGATSVTPFSLGVQASSLLGVQFQGDALLFVGEIGGNDYNYAFAKQLTPPQVMALVPPVVAEVEKQLDRLLSAQPRIKKMIVLGQFPMGCISLYLGQAQAAAAKNTTLPLDTHGCVAAVSAVTDLHDVLLKAAVEGLRRKHKQVEIVFFDLGRAYLDVLDHAAGLGFLDTARPCYLSATLLKLLPSSGGAATASVTVKGGGKVCSHPANYFSWDGIHLTDAMHRALVTRFLYASSGFADPHPNFLTPCV